MTIDKRDPGVWVSCVCPICKQGLFIAPPYQPDDNWKVCHICESTRQEAVTWWRAGYRAGRNP